MKKLLSLVVALALVLTTMGTTAFAAVSDDVTDTDVKAAVDRLAAFGLVAGMEDGKFHPDNKLTRAEASKLIVVALGLGSAADAAKGTTQFSDIAASHWATGYINVAAGQGLVKGIGNGQFAPEAEVTYAQIVTMLVRAIGYKDEFLPGAWPGNYVAKAADAGIDDDVVFTPDQVATRGATALMLNNTLDADIVKITRYENGQPIWEVLNNVTLLGEKLDFEKEEDIRVLANNRLTPSLGANDVTLLVTKASSIDGTSYAANATPNFEVDSAVNTEAFLGCKVKAYFDGDTIKYMEKVKANEVFVDYVKDVEEDRDGNYDRLGLKIKDAYYTFDSAAKAYRDGSAIGLNTAGAQFTANNIGRFVVENNEIVWAEIIDATGSYGTGDANNAFVVQSVDATEKLIKGVDGVADEDTEIDFANDFDSYQIISLADWSTLSLDDIEVNNVLYLTEYDIDGDDVATVYVLKDNTVTGELTTYKAGSAKVGGTSYDLVKYDTSTIGTADEIGTTAYYGAYSYNNMGDVDTWNIGDPNLEDVSGSTVTVVKDLAGQLRLVIGDVNTTSDAMYGVILRTYPESGRAKIYTVKADGTADDVTYTFEDDADLDAGNDGTADYSVGDVVKFKLNKDGEIADDEFKAIDEIAAADNHTAYGPTADVTGPTLGKTSIDMAAVTNGTATAGRSIKINDSTKIFDLGNAGVGTVLTVADLSKGGAAATLDAGDFSMLTWSNIKEKGLSGDYAIIADTKDVAQAVFFFNYTTSLGGDDFAAYVVEKYKNGDKTYAMIKEYGEDAKEYELDQSVAVFNNEEPAVVKITGNGKLSLSAADGQTFDGTDVGFTNFQTVAGWVYDKDGDMIKVGLTSGTAVWYTRTSDTVIYDGDSSKNYSVIKVGDEVYMVTEENSYARVIEIDPN